MAEEKTVAETGAQTPAAEGSGGKTFTQEQVDSIVKDRLARAKATPPADYEELKKKAAEWDKVQEAQKSDLERATARAERAEKELAAAKEEIARAALVSKVSKDTGVPAELLHGSTEEELAASAEAVATYARAQRPGYPQDKGGSATGGAKVSVESIESIKNPVERLHAIARNRDLYK